MHIAYNKQSCKYPVLVHVSAYMGIANMLFLPSEDDTMTVSSIQSVRQVNNSIHDVLEPNAADALPTTLLHGGGIVTMRLC